MKRRNRESRSRWWLSSIRSSLSTPKWTTPAQPAPAAALKYILLISLLSFFFLLFIPVASAGCCLFTENPVACRAEVQNVSQCCGSNEVCLSHAATYFTETSCSAVEQCTQQGCCVNPTVKNCFSSTVLGCTPSLDDQRPTQDGNVTWENKACTTVEKCSLGCCCFGSSENPQSVDGVASAFCSAYQNNPAYEFSQQQNCESYCKSKQHLPAEKPKGTGTAALLPKKNVSQPTPEHQASARESTDASKLTDPAHQRPLQTTQSTESSDPNPKPQPKTSTNAAIPRPAERSIGTAITQQTPTTIAGGIWPWMMLLLLAGIFLFTVHKKDRLSDAEKKLHTYALQKKREGYTKKEIEQALLAKGWDAQVTKRVLRRV
ncbi:hypothetical protein HZB02_01045 [Candidatus Woesearchaeota archaeon]|nr:hypothetical protein [Candidatus Woesearchaeota archaeon]